MPLTFYTTPSRLLSSFFLNCLYLFCMRKCSGFYMIFLLPHHTHVPKDDPGTVLNNPIPTASRPFYTAQDIGMHTGFFSTCACTHRLTKTPRAHKKDCSTSPTFPAFSTKDFVVALSHFFLKYLHTVINRLLFFPISTIVLCMNPECILFRV